ncbi:MAG: hypothetical protein AAFR31_16560 [Cyanobacteria bacterium J06627_8]
MLTQLVRPLVRSQIQTLANSKVASGKLVNTISNWLGYLGVHAEVKQLQAQKNRIQVSLLVGKPEQCSEDEWQRILENLGTTGTVPPASVEKTYDRMSESQQRQAARLLAHIIQVGNADALEQWEGLEQHLSELSMSAKLLQNIRAALKVPQQIDSILEKLEPEVTAFALSQAISIALIDNKISSDEDSALKSIYSALEHSSVGPA